MNKTLQRILLLDNIYKYSVVVIVRGYGNMALAFYSDNDSTIGNM
jgi:hypothetical protein